MGASHGVFAEILRCGAYSSFPGFFGVNAISAFALSTKDRRPFWWSWGASVAGSTFKRATGERGGQKSADIRVE